MKKFFYKKSRHIKIGKKGETLACRLLRAKHYKILFKNYKPGNKSGEIDIVARDGRTICFIEVKTRYNFKNSHSEHNTWVSNKQVQRIINAGKSYLNEINIEKVRYRFDLIEVSINKYGLKSIYHWQRDFGKTLKA